MTPADIQSLLKPGDILLYRPKGIFGFFIKEKTWHNVAHCELYTGKGFSAAARDGLGVSSYPWRNTELAYVLRPTVHPDDLDWVAYHRWFLTVNGQGYDWWGLRRFMWFQEVHHGNNQKMFCSEFLARALWMLKANVLSENDDADAIAPFAFLLSPNVTVIATAASLGTT